MLHLLLLAKHKLTAPEQLHTNRSAGSLPCNVPNDGADEGTCHAGGQARQDHSASRAGGRGDLPNAYAQGRVEPPIERVQQRRRVHRCKGASVPLLWEDTKTDHGYRQLLQTFVDWVCVARVW